MSYSTENSFGVSGRRGSRKTDARAIFLGAILIFTVWSSAASARSSNPTDDSEKLVGERNFLSGYTAIVREGVINVVIEIPAGTNAKWEVSTDGESIHWEIRKSEPRVVQYLPYPGNYGMVPRTRLPEEAGGDGDPLDVLILGPAAPRGSIVQARPIAVLGLLDGGQRDDKILAVPLAGPMSDVTGLKSLNRKYPGISEIVRTWFSHYKGDKIEPKSIKGSNTAWSVIHAAADAFEAER